MLTVHDPFSGADIKITVAGGDVIRVGFVIPAEAGPFTSARVLVVGDLLRRVVEDVYSAQVLAAVIATNHSVAERVWESGPMVRPVLGMFTTAAEAEAGLGKPLDLVVMVARAEDEPGLWPPAVAVAPVRATVPYPGAGPATARFALANINHTHRLDVTSSLLERSQAVLSRWRDRVAQWSRHPGRPIPPAWRTAVIAAFDDDLNVPRAAELMSELEDAERVEPGAKFEAFNYVDRVLAIDLGRGLGRTQR